MHDYIRLNTLTPLAINNWLYPKIYPIHNIYENKDSIVIGAENDQGRITIPSNIPCIFEKFEEKGVYLIDDNDMIYVYICNDVNKELLYQLFNT